LAIARSEFAAKGVTTIRLAVVLLTATIAAGAACAQSGDGVWPNRPVHFVVPFPAGGSAAMVGQARIPK